MRLFFRPTAYPSIGPPEFAREGTARSRRALGHRSTRYVHLLAEVLHQNSHEQVGDPGRFYGMTSEGSAKARRQKSGSRERPPYSVRPLPSRYVAYDSARHLVNNR